MDFRLAGHVLPDPTDPTRPAFGSDDSPYPPYAFRFGMAAGTYYVGIPTDDANPVEPGPVRFPEQARWIHALAAACGLVWREEGWPGAFYTDTAETCFALIDAMLARGIRLQPPTTAQELEEWRTRLSVQDLSGRSMDSGI